MNIQAVGQNAIGVANHLNFDIARAFSGDSSHIELPFTDFGNYGKPAEVYVTLG
jgi:hypothetical protein